MKVIAGADKGVTGRVLRIIADKNKVVVEGVNLVHRHIRRSQKNPQGGRVRRESPVHLSNVMVLDPVEDVPTKIGRKLADPEKGSLGWTRFSRRSGESLVAGTGKAQKTKKSKKAKE